MNTEVQQVKSYQQKVSFMLTVDEISKQQKKAFASFKRKASVKGFRKGKAPDSIIQSMYGKAIEAQSIDDAINDSFREYLNTSKTHPLSQAQIDDVDYNEEGLKFTALIEVHPKFDLGQYENFEVEMLDPAITDEDLEFSLNKVREDFSTKKSVSDGIEKGHFVAVKITPELADSEGEIKEIEIGVNPDDELEKEIIGLKTGDEKQITFKGDKVNLKIESVEKKILPELTDNFVKTIDKKFESLEMFKEEVKKDIALQKEQHSKEQMRNSLIEKIITEHNSLEVPPTMLDSYLNDMVESAKKQYGAVGITDEVIRNIYKEIAEKALKWEYIKQAIIKKEEIKVEKADEEEYFAYLAEKSKYDIKDIKKMYKSHEQKHQFQHDIIERKLNTIMEEKNKISIVKELTKPQAEEDKEQETQEA